MERGAFIKRAINVWFYHKWKMVGAIFVAAALFVGVRSCVQRDEPDLFVLYAHDRSVNSIQTRQLEEWFEEKVSWVAPQLDGEVTVISTANTDQWTGFSSTAMVTQITSGEGILYVLTEDVYQLLHKNNVLDDLTPYVGESVYLDGDRYYLTSSGVLDTPLFKNDETEYYLCIRKVAGTSFEGVERYEKQLELAKKILEVLPTMEK